VSSSPFNPAVLLLSAGNSLRFEGIKVLAELGGTSILKAAIDKLPHIPLHVATGQYHDEIEAHLSNEVTNRPYSLIKCPRAHLGIGFTISDAVTYMSANLPSYSHLFIVLADQVALTREELELILKQSQQHLENIVCAEFDGQPSAPAIFPSTFFSDLISLSGDQGAKKLLIKNINNAKAIAIDNARIDIDTRDQLSVWQNKQLNMTQSETT